MNSLELFSLSGKSALVTGGGRGIGKTIAFALAEAGANVAVASRDQEACAKVAEEITKNTQRKTFSGKLDITEKKDIEEIVQAVQEKFSSIDILVNNSGVTWGAPLEEMPLEKWDKVIKVNLTGTFLMCQAIVPLMKKQKWGRIINVSSVAGIVASPAYMQTAGYIASKGGIISLTRDLAVRLAEDNIVVNAIAPGFMPTKMSKPITDRFGDMIKATNPMKRMGEEDDLKGVVVFLASEASRYVTGQVIAIDGGYTAS
jgi:NAD(P)-dependent dehydrogenase (short-subunit alcohol dehydrogenase family)